MNCIYLLPIIVLTLHFNNVLAINKDRQCSLRTTVILYYIHITTVTFETQQFVLCVLLRYMALSTI